MSMEWLNGFITGAGAMLFVVVFIFAPKNKPPDRREGE